MIQKLVTQSSHTKTAIFDKVNELIEVVNSMTKTVNSLLPKPPDEPTKEQIKEINKILLKKLDELAFKYKFEDENDVK